MADHITILGFAIGIFGAVCIAFQLFWLGLIGILVNRLCDGLDGAVARLSGVSDAGGYLDIVLDFIFYSAIALSFGVADPSTNALAAALLIFSFMGTGSSFLAFAIMAEKHAIKTLDYGKKSLYFLGGITEGFETIVFFVLMCLMPHYFVYLACLFAGLCAITTVTRIVAAYHMLRQV